MRLHRLVNDINGDFLRTEADGGMTRGSLFQDEDGVVRFVTVAERLAMSPVGSYYGGRHGVFEQAPPG